MKLQGAKKVHYNTGPNMTPLVDIVMVILIFFMLAATFTGSEHFLVSNVPVEAKGAGGTPPSGVPVPTKFTITISQDGQYYIAKAGKFSSVKSTDREKAKQQLTADLKEQLAAFNDAGIKTDDIKVVIYPLANVTLDNIVPSMEAAQDAGFTKVGFGIEQQ